VAVTLAVGEGVGADDPELVGTGAGVGPGVDVPVTEGAGELDGDGDEVGAGVAGGEYMANCVKWLTAAVIV